MKRNEDISILITNKAFRKILTDWIGYTDDEKNSVCQEYKITSNDVEELRQLWLGLKFKKSEQTQANVEHELQATIWKLSESKNTVARSRIRQLYDQFAKIAAILIIPLFLYTAYVKFFEEKLHLTDNISQMVTVSSQAGTITNLMLPDGSEVFINAGSSISYPRQFSEGIRKVSLTGEAYFEVVKNAHKPMIVFCRNLNVKVYGTSFNVKSYPDENFEQVTLVEGRISLSSQVGKFNGQDEYFITPNQTITYINELKELEVQNGDTYRYTAWMDGTLVFKNETFGSILNQLSRKFNVEIELKDRNLASVRMDAVFKDENIHEILRLLSLSTSFNYRYIEREKLPDGSFVKSKIFIEKQIE